MASSDLYGSARLYDSFSSTFAHPDWMQFFVRQRLDPLGGDIVLIGTAGSGAFRCRTVRVLCETHPSIPAIGIDSFDSVLFDFPAGPWPLYGMSGSIYPSNLQHEYFAQVHGVASAPVDAAARRLHARDGWYGGPTSGVVSLITERLCTPHQTVMRIAPAEGHRYADTVYDDTWRYQHGGSLPVNADGPQKANHPAAGAEPRACINWERRTFEAVPSRARAAVAVLEQIHAGYCLAAA